MELTKQIAKGVLTSQKNIEVRDQSYNAIHVRASSIARVARDAPGMGILNVLACRDPSKSRRKDIDKETREKRVERGRNDVHSRRVQGRTPSSRRWELTFADV